MLLLSKIWVIPCLLCHYHPMGGSRHNHSVPAFFEVLTEKTTLPQYLINNCNINKLNGPGIERRNEKPQPLGILDLKPRRGVPPLLGECVTNTKIPQDPPYHHPTIPAKTC